MSLKYTTTGPHIQSRESIEGIMDYIVLALAPALAAAVLFFGPYALYLTLATAAASAWIEIPFVQYKYSLRRPFGDGSAFAAGMILGLSLSPASAWWVPFAGAALLVLVGKQVFGGLGNNIFNPALVARAILLLSWPNQLTEWVSPIDGVSTATPLGGLSTDYLSLFLGDVPGSLGETSVIALLLGGLFLLAKGLIVWRVPIAVLAGAAAAAFIFGVDIIYTLLSGSLMFGAIFMATDMVTSPTGKTSRIIYGVGCGFLSVFIRIFTLFPEGITFAFLIMNGISHLLDLLGADPIFGQVELRKRRIFRTVIAAGAALGMTLLLGAGFTGRSMIAGQFTDVQTGRSVRQVYPDADRIVAGTVGNQSVTFYRVYQGRDLLGFFASMETTGYGGPMTVEAVMDSSKVIRQVRIGDHSESPTLGSRIRSESFLGQYAGFDQDSREKLIESADILSGATISSRAVTNALEQILAALDDSRDPDAKNGTLPAVADGEYTGNGRGYQGPIQVQVSVRGGRIIDIAVISHGETPAIGEQAMRSLSSRVLDEQEIGLDAVSGATGTSRGFLSAIGDALGAN